MRDMDIPATGINKTSEISKISEVYKISEVFLTINNNQQEMYNLIISFPPSRFLCLKFIFKNTMDTQPESQPTQPENPKIPWTAVVRLFLLIVIMMVVLFLSAGRLDWWEAWAYIVQALLVLLVSRAILLVKYPDVALERAEAGKKEDVKPWDKILSPVTAVYGPLVSWVLAGLDLRYGLTPDLPNAIQVIALVVLTAGSVIGTWAMIANRFFSSHVRIQTDRGHTVVNTGLYRIVRHPGYAGAVISWLASPIFFSSYLMVIPAILMIILNMIRTYLEDETLQEELPGYKEYARKVRFRLFPGIW